MLVGVILILSSLVLPWWTSSEEVNASNSLGSVNYTVNSSFYPGSHYIVTCYGNHCPAKGKLTYSSNIGRIYDLAEWMVIGSGLFAIAGVALGLLGGLARYERLQILLTFVVVIVGIALAIACPVLVMAGQPGAIDKDSPNFLSCSTGGGASPCNSFSGNYCGYAFNGGCAPFTWGSGQGLVLEVVGGLVLVIGFLVMFFTFREASESTFDNYAADLV
jgi:uncharacterized membrane protein